MPDGRPFFYFLNIEMIAISMTAIKMILRAVPGIETAVSTPIRAPRVPVTTAQPTIFFW